MDIRNARTAVLVDRHPLLLDALETLLAQVDIRVLARTTFAQDAEALLSEHRPDLLIVGSAAIARDGADCGGWSALHRAKRVHPSVRCILLSDRDDAREREEAFAAGAAVFCARAARGDDVLFAIRQSFAPSIHFANPGHAAPTAANGPPDDRDTALGDLTKRETEILRLVAEGGSNAQLAQTLWVTEQTVKFHLSNIYRKLNVGNRTEAARWAHRHGLLADPGPGVETQPRERARSAS